MKLEFNWHNKAHYDDGTYIADYEIVTEMYLFGVHYNVYHDDKIWVGCGKTRDEAIAIAEKDLQDRINKAKQK
jgi:hypothetical protein